NSGKTFISVPFNRMGNFMQEMNSLGGKIVSIRPSDAPAQAADSSEQTSEE
ncbi:MAG: phycobilisome linker polypeptide, partial [Leptolyngbyaceae bacterium]|nr:phycobilisome linker polypeptide [Leptolyngbyaceae bacterium]